MCFTSNLSHFLVPELSCFSQLEPLLMPQVSFQLFFLGELCMCDAQSLNHAWLFCNPMDCSLPVLRGNLSMGFSRQECRDGLPFPPLGDLPNPGTEPVSPVSLALAGWFFSTEPPWDSQVNFDLLAKMVYPCLFSETICGSRSVFFISVCMLREH